MKQIWNAEELGLYWSLSYEELELLKTKPNKSHLAFCMQLKYYQYYGVFPKDKKELANVALQYISEQLGIPNSLRYYDWENRTARRHRQEILTFLKIRELKLEDRSNIISWLVEIIFPKGISTSEAFEYALEWLHQNKILRPAKFRIDKIITASYSKFEKSLFENICNELSDDSKAIIDYCLEDNTDSISFAMLKSDPGRVSLDSVLKEIEKLEFINQLELPEQQLISLNPKIMSRIRSRVFSETAWELKRHPVYIRYVCESRVKI